MLAGPRANIKSELDQWLYLLAESQKFDADAIPAFLESHEIREAIDIMRVFAKSEVERDLYERRLEYQRSEY